MDNKMKKAPFWRLFSFLSGFSPQEIKGDWRLKLAYY